VHFFNPPRYMHLVELIACDGTDPSLLDDLEKFLVTTLGKGVIRAKDTPNFIANRVGVFSMLATIHHAQQFGLGFDVVDALTGPLIGRPKSATFRTADVVGLDTFAHVVKTMADTLPNDPWHKYYAIPDWLRKLIDSGALGQKTRRGVYQKVGKDIQVLDVAAGSYRVAGGKADDDIVEILKNKNTAEKFAQLHASTHPQAQFLWSIFAIRSSIARASRGNRQQCTRPRPRDPLGFRLEPGAVRDLAGGGLARSRTVDCRRHRRPARR
jgi:3-hydroxyacyl-CoA dehydrogenase